MLAGSPGHGRRRWGSQLGLGQQLEDSVDLGSNLPPIECSPATASAAGPELQSDFLILTESVRQSTVITICSQRTTTIYIYIYISQNFTKRVSSWLQCAQVCKVTKTVSNWPQFAKVFSFD